MPTKLDDKQQQDDRYNPYNYDYGTHSDLRQAEEQASTYSNDDQSVDDLQQREKAESSGFKNSYTGAAKRKSGGKKAGIIGGASSVAIAAAVAFFVNQIGMSLPAIADPIDDVNNTLADTFQHRSPKVLTRILGGGDLCTHSEVGLRCKSSKVSNKTLHSLYKKNITANFADGSSYTGGKTKGFPDKKPTSYTFKDSRSGRTQTVAASGLADFLSDDNNFRHSVKILGRNGAIHLRGEVWRGKALNKLFGSYNMKFTGAKGYEKGKTAKATYESSYKNIQKDTPSTDKVQEAASKDAIKGKFDKMSKRLGRGGAAYLTLAGGCMVVKAPSIVAASVTAVQLARIAPIFNNTILSPASQQKVSGVDKENAITGDQLGAIMTVLTHKTPRASDGKMTSALDSKILLSAMGVNHGKPELNPGVAPGYSILNNKWVVGSQNIEKSTEPYCNFMLNPVTMYTFATADAAVSIGSGFVTGGAGTVLSKVASQVVQFGLTYAGGELASFAASKATQQIVKKIVEDNVIGTATGEELGDVLGTGAMTVYSSGSLTRNLPVLSQAQLGDYNVVKNQVESRQQSYDIATLSPFDISSKYTFLGSMTHSMQRFAFANQLYTDSSIYSVAAAITSIPSFITSPSTVGAATQDYQRYCSYAGEFGLDTGDASTTPAINAAGLPCTGITQQQAEMSVDRALDIVESEGWVDLSADYPEDATPEELIGKVIDKDSPVAAYIETCSHPEDGNILFDSAGCMFPGSGLGAGQDAVDNNSNYCGTYGCAEDAGSGSVDGDVSTEAMRAIPVFLMDFQASQIIQGINSSQDPAPTADDAPDTDSGEQVTGDAAELAQQLLDSPNVRFWDQSRDKADKSRPSDNLRSIAAGELASTSTRGDAGGKKTNIDVSLLKFLVELSKKEKIMINALAGQNHSTKSKHYSGLAVDLDCQGARSTSYSSADSVAKKYGVGRNNENCTPSGNNHWHYEVGR